MGSAQCCTPTGTTRSPTTQEERWGYFNYITEFLYDQWSKAGKTLWILKPTQGTFTVLLLLSLLVILNRNIVWQWPTARWWLASGTMTLVARIIASSATGRNVSKHPSGHSSQLNHSSGLIQRYFSISLHISKQHRPSTPNQEPLSGWLHLLVPELLQAGGGAGDLGRSPGGLQAAGGQPGQHRHELRPGLRRGSGAAGQRWRLDRAQAQGDELPTNEKH